jgi:hypothetical protein
MELTIGQHNKIVKESLSKSEIEDFEFIAYADGIAIARSSKKFFLVILNKNFSLCKIFRATKESVLEVFRLWMKDLAADLRHPTIKVDLLNLSEKD